MNDFEVFTDALADMFTHECWDIGADRKVFFKLLPESKWGQSQRLKVRLDSQKAIVEYYSFNTMLEILTFPYVDPDFLKQIQRVATVEKNNGYDLENNRYARAMYRSHSLCFNY